MALMDHGRREYRHLVVTKVQCLQGPLLEYTCARLLTAWCWRWKTGSVLQRRPGLFF